MVGETILQSAPEHGRFSDRALEPGERRSRGGRRPRGRTQAAGGWSPSHRASAPATSRRIPDPSPARDASATRGRRNGTEGLRTRASKEALPDASPLRSRPPRQAPRPARRAAPRVAPPARARAAPARPDRARADRARRLLRFLVYGGMDGGRAGDWTVDSLRWLLGAVHYGVPAALLAAGAILVLRPVLPGGAAVPRGRDLPVRRALPRPRGRHARPRPRRRAPRLLGSRVGADRAAAWPARRSTGPAPRCSAASARTSSPCSCSSPACCCSRARPSRAW